ncbi:MAG: DUF1501 domain-containing protein [Betaproteobacteria bacterium]|nr:DUF1501 domain-containing protein [Betaproteobacteria bacterium]
MNRRDFLRRSGALTAAGLAGSLDLVSLSAHAQAAADYRALVCIFLFGGNDGNNLLLPADSAGYAQYAAVRGAGSGIALTQAELLPIQPANLDTPFGLHPALKELQPLFASGELAALANVGTLTQPTSKAQYAAGVRPDSLYSHSDQQNQWQTSIASGTARTGWGGRLADVLAPQAGGAFPVITSTAGVTLFVTGTASRPLAIPVTGGFGLTGYNNTPAAKARLRGAEFAAGDRSRQHLRRCRVGDHRAGDRAVGDGESDPHVDGQSRRAAVRRPILVDRPTAARRRADDRGTRSDRRQAADLLRVAGRFRHPRQPAGDTADAVRTAVAGVEGVLRRHGSSGRGAAGDELHAVGFRAHLQAGRRRRQRPRLGQPPPGAGRRGQGRHALRTLSDAGAGRPRRRRARGTVDSHHRRGPVRRDAGEVARCLDHGPRAGVSQPGALPGRQPGVPRLINVSGVTAYAGAAAAANRRIAKLLRA